MAVVMSKIHKLIVDFILLLNVAVIFFIKNKVCKITVLYLN